MKIALIFFLSCTLAWADIKVTSTGYVTTKADTALIYFTMGEMGPSIERAGERLDKRVVGLIAQAQAVTQMCGLQILAQKIEEADRYSTKVSCENSFLVTRDMCLYIQNDLARVKGLLSLLFEGDCAARPTQFQQTIVYGRRESAGVMLDAYEQALLEAKSRAAGMASRSGLTLNVLTSVEHIEWSTDFRGLYWEKGARLPYFESNLEDKVVVKGTWTFTFATQ